MAGSGPGPRVFLLVAAVVGPVACSAAEEAQESVIRELAVGSWACAPDAPGAANQAFTVGIDDDGTFDLAFEQGELTGTWSIEGGDLHWAFDARQLVAGVVADFDDLTLDSTGFLLEVAGPFEADDGLDDPSDEQPVDVEVHSKDSVTMSVPDGDPWTCDRR